MDTAIVVELIRLVPTVLLVLLLGVFVFRLRDPWIQRLLSRVSGVGAFGFRLELRPDEIQRTVEEAAKDRADVSPTAGAELFERARGRAPLLSRAQILWVDDVPARTINERKLMHGLGMFVEPVRSTDEALDHLRWTGDWSPYDLVITDMERAGDSTAGATLIAALQAASIKVPVIIYLGRYVPSRGTPSGAYGITDRPDTLMELVMDVLERTPPRTAA